MSLLVNPNDAGGDDNTAPRYPIIFQPYPPPKRFEEFQKLLTDKGGITPDGRPRLLLEYGGEATRSFRQFRVAKFPWFNRDEQIGVRYAGNPKARMAKYRAPTVFYNGAEMVLPDRDKSELRRQVETPIIVTIDVGRPVWVITEWLSPAKVGLGWEPKFGPYPESGYYYPIRWLVDLQNEANGYYREPSIFDMDFVDKYLEEQVKELAVANWDLDFPMPEGDVRIINGWTARALRRQSEDESESFQEYALRVLEDVIKTERKMTTNG